MRVKPADPSLERGRLRGLTRVGRVEVQTGDEGEHYFGAVGEIHRLHQEGVGAQLKGGARFAGVRSIGQHDDAQRFQQRLPLDPAQDLETIHLWHLEVQQHQNRQGIFLAVRVFALAVQIGNPFQAIPRHLDRVADFGFRQRTANDEDIVFIVLHQKDFAAIFHRQKNAPRKPDGQQPLTEKERKAAARQYNCGAWLSQPQRVRLQAEIQEFSARPDVLGAAAGTAALRPGPSKDCHSQHIARFGATEATCSEITGVENDQAQPVAHPVTPSASRPILLAEASREDEELFRGALYRTGLQNPVHSVHSADEAIKYLGREGHYVNRDLFPTPQVLVLDPNLPGKSGWEVLKWVREQREKLDLTALVVIILGGSGSPAEEDMAFRLGAMGYHIKPQTSEELEQVIKRICGSWQSPGKS